MGKRRIDHVLTEEPVCPHCGAKASPDDGPEFHTDESGTFLCVECDKPFSWVAEWFVHFTTCPLAREQHDE